MILAVPASVRSRLPARLPAPPAAAGVADGNAPARPWKALVLACLGLAALSLLGPAQPTYDPWAWLIWGREITQLDLDTVSGPSWKPLPIFFTTPFALFGDAAPELWLLVARAGGLLAIAMAYRLAGRLAGWPAGLVAAAALFLADDFIFNFARGNSEGLLVAVCLWAVERHLDGRRADAFVLGLAAALLRPEVWPFFGLYGLWLAWREPRRRALVIAAFAANAFLWLAPEYWGSGDWLRAANRARRPNPDSPAFAEHPFLEVFRLSRSILSVPVLLGALAALVVAARRRVWGVRLALGAAAALLMIVVALMTEGGFAGNLRYVALPAAFVCVLAGVGWVELVRALAARAGRAAAVALAVALAAGATPFVVSDVGELGEGGRELRKENRIDGTLAAAIAKAGGSEKIKRCGQVFTGPFQVQALAWHLRMHGGDIEIEADPPGIVVAGRWTDMANDERFRFLTDTRIWVIRRRCAR